MFIPTGTKNYIIMQAINIYARWRLLVYNIYVYSRKHIMYHPSCTTTSCNNDSDDDDDNNNITATNELSTQHYVYYNNIIHLLQQHRVSYVPIHIYARGYGGGCPRCAGGRGVELGVAFNNDNHDGDGFCFVSFRYIFSIFP